MRVLFDHQIFLAQPFGGISRYFAEIYRCLQMQPGCIPALSAFGVINEYVQPPLSFPWVKGILRRYAPVRALSLGMNSLCSTWAVHVGRFDVFHPTYYNPYFLGALGKRPFVITVYDMTHELFPQYFLPGDPTSVRKKLLVQKASRVLAISQSTKDDLVRLFGVDPQKIVVTHLSGGFAPDITRIQLSHLDFLKDVRYLLFVGRRDGYKNFNGFISAAAPFLQQDRTLQVFCAGGGVFTEQEHALIQAVGLEGRVRYYAPADAELAYFYRHAVAFVFPSFYEGFGIPVLEAFSCGCPVIAAHTSSLPEVGGDAALYFDPHDSAAILQAVRRVVVDTAFRDQLKSRGSGRVRSFSWKKTVELTQHVYREIAGV